MTLGDGDWPWKMMIAKMRPEPRNKGKLIAPKPPLRPSQVWAIRTRLQIENRRRDVALFNLAIDSKLRGCDVVAIRVEGVARGGYALNAYKDDVDARYCFRLANRWL